MSRELAKKHYQLGKMYLQDGSPEKAVNEFKRALAYAPQYPDIYFHLGVAHEYMMALQEAATQFKKAIDIHPGYTDAHLHLGIVYFKQKEYDRAKAKLEEVVKREEIAQAYYYLGEIAFEKAKAGLGSFEEAKPYYEKAIQLNPELVEAYMSMGKLLRKLGQVQESNKYFDKADRIRKGVREP